MEAIRVGFNSTSSTETNEDEFEASSFSEEYINLGLEYTFLGIALLGIVGNVFLLLMARYMVNTKKKAGCVLLYYMTISDMITQMCYICSKLAEKFSSINQHSQVVMCLVYVFFRGSFLNASSLMTSLTIIERTMAAYFPFRYKDTVKVATMIKVGAVCMAVTLVYSGLSTYIYGSGGGMCLRARNDISYALLFVFVTSTIMVFIVIPSLTTASLNNLLILKIKRRNNSAEQAAAGSSTTRMLLGVTSVYLASMFVYILLVLGRVILESHKPNWTVVERTIVTILEASYDFPGLLSSSANFPVLFCCMKSFRMNLKLALEN